MVFLVICVAVILGVSFFCSLTEAVFLSISAPDMAALGEKFTRAASLLRRLKENPDKPIAAILIVNNLVNVAGAVLSGMLFAKVFGQKWIGVFSFVLALVIIQWAEYLPKTLGVKYKRTLAVFLTHPLVLVTHVLSPLIVVLEFMNRPFTGRQNKAALSDPLGDIALLARSASLSRLISSEQKNIVERGIKLSHMLVRDIMATADEIKYLSSGMSMPEALVEAHIHYHTRYLLIEGNDLDQVLGFVNLKDIVNTLKINPANPSLRGVMRPILAVYEDEPVAGLLKKLIKGYQHIAVVRNHAGKTVGLVTLEDVVESIVGNIEDEYDLLPAHVHRLAEGRYLLGGGVLLSELRGQADLELPEKNISLNDWLSGMLPGIPKNEQKIPFNDVVFTIRKIRRNKIHEVIASRSA